jgi:putative flippase GtrA
MAAKNSLNTWGKKKTKQLLKVDFVRFGMVGAAGFIVTAILLKVLHGILKLDVIPATLLSGEGGLLSNFVFHEKWTYKYVDHHYKSVWKKFIHFHMSSWTGIVLITVIESIGVKVLHLNYLVSLVIASGITMFWNFFWTKYFIFKGHTPPVLLNPEDTVPETK